MIRLAGATIIALHGVIHLIGFVVPWHLATVDGFPYRVTALGGLTDLGEVGARVVGLVWLACAIGFLVAGVGIGRQAPWALPLTAALATASIAICLLGLPETAAGIVVNIAILGVIVWATRAHTHSVEMTS
ncbi:MAG: hypothetical protein IPO93_09680 [Actinobacteria bacterium]|nr:hypothetical protein [Actinomycetota bacterium]